MIVDGTTSETGEAVGVRYAHSTNGPIDAWEPLEEHLRMVAEGDVSLGVAGAADFADAFGAADWGRVLGWWHDLGKYSEAFQEYLKCSADRADVHGAEFRGSVDHSTAGARCAVEQFGNIGRLLAYCIAGHHAGLPDWEPGPAGLRQRLAKRIDPTGSVPRAVLNQTAPQLPAFHWRHQARALAFQIAFFVRMVFSSLVDADYLATESFMQPGRRAQRPKNSSTPANLLCRLDDYLAHLNQSSGETLVNRCRREVLETCRQRAELRPGLFSLNVPTGGGKTLSSLAFGLSHARAHGLRRVVYAIPFTSIVEQTASIFRTAMGDLDGAVLEHHSNIDPADPARETERSRLAAENWDATLIVTTNVQFFESMFAARASRCRKLHRLAKSVIILDEAQTLPPELLAPTLAALEELSRNYGSTIVLCTATQPAIEARKGFPIGLTDVRPIVEDSISLHEALRRTCVEVAGLLDDDEIATRLSGETQVLCIVNSRRHAADLFKRLTSRSAGRENECLHLSADLCPAHRAEVVAEIRRRLDAEGPEPCRVISTQVIEAGVDVDFPTVYRAAAGLDSIAQAAGRCNREGRRETGQVIVFDYDDRDHRPPPFIKRAAALAREVIQDQAADLLSPGAIEEFFRLQYWQQGGDDGSGWDRGRGEGRPSVMECFAAKGLECQFRAAAERYRLIEDTQTPVLVPWGQHGRELRRELEGMSDPPDSKRLRGWDRRAQRYVVGVFDSAFRALMDNRVILERHGRYYLGNDDAYDARLGLNPEAVGLDAEGLIQ